MHQWSSPAGPLSRGSTWVSDAAGDKLGLGLGKPAANLGLPELRELDSDGVDGVDLIGIHGKNMAECKNIKHKSINTEDSTDEHNSLMLYTSASQVRV